MDRQVGIRHSTMRGRVPPGPETDDTQMVDEPQEGGKYRGPGARVFQPGLTRCHRHPPTLRGSRSGNQPSGHHLAQVRLSTEWHLLGCPDHTTRFRMWPIKASVQRTEGEAGGQQQGCHPLYIASTIPTLTPVQGTLTLWQSEVQLKAAEKSTSERVAGPGTWTPEPALPG